jgi:ribosomal protein S18 acetylase RimI-like enzyme
LIDRNGEKLMSCDCCRNNAVYRCSVCGRALCAEHAKLQTVCPSCIKKNSQRYTIDNALPAKDKEKVREFVRRFWGEQEQLAFDRRFIVSELPACVARKGKEIVGFISFAETEDAAIIVALGVLPECQDAGVGRGLIEEVEAEARRTGKQKLLVSTSNDDLPALAFYQSLGFQIYEVKPDVIAEKHGKILRGVGGLPVRDEMRLQKILR